jgi:hypothetical protein
MPDPQWHAEALRRFPELAQQLAGCDTPYMVWIELWGEFENAYASANMALVANIYDYANWCYQQPRGESADDDLPTYIHVCFYEHIPTNAQALDDMPRWWSLDQVIRLKDTFSYIVGAEGYAKLLSRFGA